MKTSFQEKCIFVESNSNIQTEFKLKKRFAFMSTKLFEQTTIYDCSY